MNELKVLNSLEMNKALQEGKRVRKINWEQDEYIYMEEGKVCYKRDNIEKYSNDQWILISDSSLLDKKEKEYLRAVLRPFKGMEISITKMDYYYDDVKSDKEYICIEFDDVNYEDGFFFPGFKAGTMYKGLKLNQQYTPEELGLF